MTDLATFPAGPRAAFRSDQGLVRSRNEDLAIVDQDRGVYGVIDGVGGNAAGDLAAAIACDVILQRLARPLGTPAERVREAIAIANNEIFRRAGESPDLQGMTCVVTLAVVADHTLTVGHVGDSRLYEIRPDRIRKLTRDHSPVGEREDARELTEAEAMRHPRRNEVFRDVGGAYRDKDEDDYVDILQQRLEGDTALLLCTDGLSDMVPSAAIERIVRHYAGRPEAVVEALVAAANHAGGKDNVTVVYVEGPEFAAALRRATRERRQQAPPLSPASGFRPPRRWADALRWVFHRRTTWFALGAIAGLLSALALVWRVPAAASVSSRTLVVGPAGQGAFERIGDALLAARPGDTVRVEPGLYREQVFVTDGVNLVARVPSTVTLTRMPQAGDWVAITAVGERGGRISGIRIQASPDLPLDTGLRVAGQNRTIDLMEIEGPMRVAVELLADAATKLHGSHFAVSGPVLGAGNRARAVLTRNVFLRAGRSASPAVQLAPSAEVTLDRNLFAGFGAEIVQGASAPDRQQIAAANVIVTAEPPAAGPAPRR